MTTGAAPQEARALARVETLRLVSYLLFGTLGAVLFVTAGSLPSSRWEPLGAGSFPRLICAALVVLCALAAAGSWLKLRALPERAELGAAAREWLRTRYLVVALFVLFSLYLPAIRPLGFSVATFLFLLAAYLLLAHRRPRTILIALVLALVFSFGMNWLFADVFHVFLPKGEWLNTIGMGD